MTVPIKQALSKSLAEAFQKTLQSKVEKGEIESSFEAPREEKFGDLSSNIALKIAKAHKRPPISLAEELLKNLEALIKTNNLKDRIAKVAVEGPGFINFYFSAREMAEVIPKIRKEGGDFGRPSLTRRKNILLDRKSTR